MTQSLRQMKLEKKERLYNRVMEIRDKNRWGNTRIAEELGMSPATVGNWLYKDVSPHDEMEYSREDDASPDLLSKPDDTWLSWFAGFWEGEGSLNIGRDPSGRFRATISVTQTKDRGKCICDEIRDIFGYGSVGRIRHDNEDWSTCYTWEGGKKKYVVQITGWMLPHLRVRHKEVADARSRILEYMNNGELWTPYGERFVAENWKKSAEWVAERLGKSKEAVAKKRRRLGYYQK